MASGINHRLRVLTALLAVCFIASSAWAGKGKIQGTVTDSDSKLPIAAASVSVLGTNWGAATGTDGSYVIIGLDPGTVNVKVSSVGFHNQIITGVVIQSDVTTELKVQLVPTSVAVKEVVIKYAKPVIELGSANRTNIIGQDQLKKLRPENIDAIVGSTTGFKVDAEGKLHARGGRSGEVAFVVEGTDTRDAVVDTRNSYMVSSAAVEEVNVLTGGFNAEYGNAGAIVQITTAEGDKSNYAGRLEAQTDRVIDTYSFDTDRMELDLGGPLPFTKKWLGNPVTFYLSSIGFLTNTYTPLNANRPANDYLGIGINLPERQDNNYQTSLKLSNDLSESRKLTLYLSESYHKWDIYPYGEGGIDGNYGYGYKYDLANRPYAVNKQFSGSLTFTDQPTSKTYYTVKLTSFYTSADVAERGKNPGQMTLLDDIENNLANAFDRNGNGKLDPGEYVTGTNGFLDGYVDANGDGVYEGGGEGYEDLNMNGQWDRGEDWVDLNGNGIYDAAEPWIDVVNPLTGENNIGVYDPWDSYTDLNHNGRWDPAEPQLPEQDWNHNGKWDGERFQDANHNGHFDGWNWSDLNGNGKLDPGEWKASAIARGDTLIRKDGEGYNDRNLNGSNDTRDLQARVTNPDTPEPFIDGDFYYDTGEPFIDEPDPITGLYNGKWDPGEIWFDLPGPTLNGKYDGPDGRFEPYELFCRPADPARDHDPSRPVIYTFDEQKRGTDWPADIYHFISGKSTWINRTINDSANPVFDEPNFVYDAGKEWFDDYNGDGTWNSSDYFLNPGLYDPTAYWYERSSTENSIKFDIQSQVSKYHLIKSGAEMKYRDLQMQSIAQPDLKYTGDATLPAGSPWPDRGGVRDFYHYKPWEGAAYVQDKMEFQGLIVNAGLRLDFIIHDKKAIDEFRDRLLRDEPGAILAQRGTYRVSPRLGISHPITEQAKLYFNYGHFYQAPSFQYFYKSATANFSANSTIGNPNLEYEKTIQYELGVNTQVSTDVVIDVSGYYKDQYGLISTTDERWKNLNLNRYVNLDYGRMRGFELSIEKRPSNHYALTFNYDFSFAFGKASDQLANLQAKLNGVPYNYDEHPLDWDETHKINAYATILYDKNDHPKLLGMVLPDDWMTTLQWEFGSGLPYTPSIYTTGIDNANLILPNSARLPWHERTTLKFEKYYTLNAKKGTKFIFGITVNNLFNKQDVQAVYPETGSPSKAIHPLDPSYNPSDNRTNYDANPRNFEPGRQVSFRVGMEF